MENVVQLMCANCRTKSLSLQVALQCTDAKQHVVKGDRNYQYHSIAHQAGPMS